MEALVLRHRSVAKCSFSVVEVLASFSQLLRIPLEVEVRLSAALRMKGWGCSVFAVVVAATMLLVKVEVGVMRVSALIQCLSGRSVVVVRLVDWGGLDLRAVLEVLRCRCCCLRCRSQARKCRLVQVC